MAAGYWDSMSNPAMPLSAKLALSSACLLWAASFIATKTALTCVPPLTVVTLRLVISSVCFAVWLMLMREKVVFQGWPWLGRLTLLSLFGTGLHYGVQTIGIGYTTASNASLYAATGPLSIAIIAGVFLGERITLKKAIGIGCALIGVLIVQGIGSLRSFDFKGHLLGDVLVFISIVFWGVFTVMGKDMTRRMKAASLTAIVTFMGALYMIPVAWMEIHQRSFSLTAISAEAWGAVAFLGITCSFLATLLYVFALQQTESQKVGVYLYTIPPMSYMIAAIYLKETIGLNLIIGSLVVLTGVYLTEKG
jgi:drug/metabolite transporter (DMT)-like permease